MPRAHDALLPCDDALLPALTVISFPEDWKAVSSYSQFLSQSYRTIPISLAASSQTQIGSEPSSNFRQRLSQSIIGTKQLNAEGTDSGPPFFIHTRNRAGCSPSLVQEVGLRTLRSMGSERPISLRTLPVGARLRHTRQKEIWRSLGTNWAQLGFQMRHDDCTGVSKWNLHNKVDLGSRYVQSPG
ncbi:MAG: hypothetical protein WAK24_02340, partial [Candidatus Acidiferrales bacterium]